MHICLVHRDLHEPARGGICTLYRALAQRLLAAGHQVTLLTQDTRDPLRLDTATVVVLPRTNDLHAHRAAVARALATINPDVVDCSTWESETLHYARLPRHAPVLVRGDLSAATMGAAELVASERELLSRADATIAVSDYASRDLATAYHIAPPAVVANGVDTHRFSPRSATAPSSGYRVNLDTAGRITHRIPLQNLLADRSPVPPWSVVDDLPRLVWIGKITPMKGWDQLEQLATSLTGRAHLTVLLGHAPAFCRVRPKLLAGATILHDLADDDMPGFYRAATWLLSTSRWEGFGLAIAEALACGTPALLPAALGTAPELLASDGGRTYTTADDIDAALAAPPPIATLPARFDWDSNTTASLRLYTALTSANPTTRRQQSCASC